MAGLAAIAQAKAMGAIVRAYDVRPIVREQVESVGAEFLQVRRTGVSCLSSVVVMRGPSLP